MDEKNNQNIINSANTQNETYRHNARNETQDNIGYTLNEAKNQFIDYSIKMSLIKIITIIVALMMIGICFKFAF